MSPECVREVLAQNTPQIIFYSLFKLPLLGYEPKRAVFVFVLLNANELVLPAPFSEEGRASKANAPDSKLATHNNLKLSQTLKRSTHIAFICSFLQPHSYLRLFWEHVKAASVKTGRDDGSFSKISLTECQDALSLSPLSCVSCVPASCVHIWFVSCPRLM